jgi:hypothetical protein
MLRWRVLWAINSTDIFINAHQFISDNIDTQPATTTLPKVDDKAVKHNNIFNARQSVHRESIFKNVPTR